MVVTTDKVIEAQILALGTSAQNAELIALTRDLCCPKERRLAYIQTPNMPPG